jgi:hypothetical protein
MINVSISSEARVKLETLAPKVAELLLRQFEWLQSAQTRTQLQTKGKIKQLHGTSNTYSLAASPTHLVLFQVDGESLFISDIINVSFLDYIRRTTANAKPNQTKAS